MGDWKITIKPVGLGVRIETDSRAGDELAEQLTDFLEHALLEFAAANA